MVTNEDVKNSLGITDSYTVERDDDVKFREISHGVAFQCMHCKTAFMTSYDQMWVFRCTPKRDIWHNPANSFRYAMATECPHCKAHIATWTDNTDTYHYLGQTSSTSKN